MSSNQPHLSDLQKRHCKEPPAGTAALTAKETTKWLGCIPGWASHAKEIRKSFKFKNYYETMAFVNAVAWIAHHENHHPDMEVGYNTCTVRLSTHSVGGLSENDLICAAKIEGMIAVS